MGMVVAKKPTNDFNEKCWCKFESSNLKMSL
jgi:hypothetical protein